jgi:uncharacterized protein (TIGR03066 family)
MIKSIVFLSLLLGASFSASASDCVIQDTHLVGGWKQSSKIADYAVMGFEQEGNERRFDSWRHDRPEVSQGAWKIEKCRLTIWENPSDTKRRMNYTVLELTAERLHLKDIAGSESTYEKVHEPTVRRKLVTSSFTIQINVYCEEGNVTCNNVEYIGVNKKTGKSIRLVGKTKHTVCADKVTPCRFMGYEFQNGKTYYRVLEDGNLLVVEGNKVLLEQQGEWH